MQTITRKFIVKKIPNLNREKCFIQKRFYLYRKNGVVIRVQSSDNIFELERKVDVSELIRESEKISITKNEFEALSKIAKDTVVRDNYIMSETPRLILRIYHGRFEGLVRAEIAFQSIEEANRFIPLPWMGKEITLTPLAKDETLLDLTNNEFQKLL